MEYMVLVGVIAAFIVFIFVKGAYDEKKKEKQFIKSLYDDYGKIPEREYEAAQYASISKYFEKHKGDFYIDDITWNDLCMDAVFMQMNHTFSAAGEEYLYYTLRTPKMQEQTLKKQEEKIRFFMEQAEKRVRMQTLFAKVGKIGKFSIYTYLDFLDTVKDISNMKHVLSIIMILLSILIIPFQAQVGILLVVGVLSYNMVTYFKAKGEIEPYIISFGYIIRMLKTAEAVVKENSPVLKEENEKMKGLLKQFKKFKKGSFWLMSPTRMNGAGDPLSMLADYARMIFHLDIMQFNKMMREVRSKKDKIDELITITGSVEAAIAIGEYRVSMGKWCVPEFQKGRGICMEGGYHPLIAEPVKNSIDVRKGVLLTGSNASGKSTFLKTVAINAILAQTTYTALADRFAGEFYHIYSSMALRDDLNSGESYYIVEIKSLKRIIDAALKGQRILCFVDEVLRGTNTVERIAASAQILQSFAKENVLCFAATHDIELTSLLEKEYENYHFEEEIEEGDILFNYELKKGRARTRNAIKLLAVMGYDKKIIDRANAMAETFVEKGTWNRLDDTGYSVV